MPDGNVMKPKVAMVRCKEDSNLERGRGEREDKRREEIRSGGVENFLASCSHKATRK
jgi:hypothetical protein